MQNTLRYATGRTSTATSDEGKAIAALDRIRANMQTQVYNMFSTCDEFVEVGSNAAGQSSVKCSNSIENIHNAIHNNVGGPSVDGGSPGGHMTFLSLAAFDPAFWMHHCNVDRLYAMWQGLYPNNFSGSQNAPSGTFTIPKGSTQNVNSPLTPFHKNAAGDFWTTTQLRDWKVLKYTYPEFANSDGSKGAIASYVNKLYGPSATATAGSSKRNAIPQSQVGGGSPTSSAVPSATADATPLKADNGSTYQYVANIETNRFALGGSYNIYLYNGAPSSEDPVQLLLDPKLIGPMGVLAEAGMTGSDLVVSGSIPLTEVLQKEVLEGDLVDMEAANVVPYLKANLAWRIVGPDGSVVDPDTVPDFEISVYESTATPATEYSLPSWSEFIPLAEITKSKAGGATPQTIETPPSSS
jgi:tyrosinase